MSASKPLLALLAGASMVVACGGAFVGHKAVSRAEAYMQDALAYRAQADDFKARLAVMRTTYDGYAIAEKDLAQRGPGDFLAPADGPRAGGIRQSGGFRLAENCSDTELMNHAFPHAREMLTDDPELAGYPELKRTVEQMYARSGNILN